jgi:phosphotransferase system enzyme I (PtsP)
MFPMVTLPEEIEAARDMLEKEIALRRKRGGELPARIRVGAMIETPSAAWRADEIAARVDFLSIGGNDLAQFYFAADREAEWAHRFYDPLETGFLSFVASLARRIEPTGRPLAYCGEQAADPAMAAALIAVGVRRFSVPATAVGGFRRMVRALDVSELAHFLKQAPLKVPLRAQLMTFLEERGAMAPLTQPAALTRAPAASADGGRSFA